MAARAGQRSGDQFCVYVFCVYVCDRLVLPTLGIDDFQRVAQGELSLDRLTRDYIHQRLRAYSASRDPPSEGEGGPRHPTREVEDGSRGL